jgi:hypothetical protein
MKGNEGNGGTRGTGEAVAFLKKSSAKNFFGKKFLVDLS